MFNADRTLGSNRWPVIRLVAGSSTEVVLLSTRFFALTTHWNKCTVPCCGDDCPLCSVLPARGLFYVAAMCCSRVSILELASQSASHFEQHAKLLHSGLRPGLVFSLQRRGAKSPVRSEVVRFQEKCSEVSALELATRVMAIYKYPCPNPGEDLFAYELRCRGVARVRCSRAAELISNERSRQMAR
jgi:hypothetical protein